MKTTNIEKRLEGKSDGSTAKELMKLAKNEEDIIFDIESDIVDILTQEHRREAPDMNFLDWLDTKPKSYFIKLPLGLSKGGTVISISDYLKHKEKPKIKRISLDSVAPGKAIADLTDAEREVVNRLLRMTFGRDD